jgi:MSHA biogenesis protein MshN
VVEFSDTARFEDFVRDFNSGFVRQARARWENGRSIIVLDLSAPAGDVTAYLDNSGSGARLNVIMDRSEAAEVEAAVPSAERPADYPVAVVTPGQMTMGPAGSDALYDEAAALCSSGKVAEGIAKLTELIGKDPAHVQGRLLLATTLVQNGDAREAADKLDAGLREHPEIWQWAQLRAQLAVDAGASLLAYEILSRSPPPLAEQADYHAFLAAVEQRIGRHGEAVNAYRSVLGLRPQRGVWWIGLGISLHALARDREAAVAFKNALSDQTLTPQLRNFAQARLASIATGSGT